MHPDYSAVTFSTIEIHADPRRLKSKGPWPICQAHTYTLFRSSHIGLYQ